MEDGDLKKQNKEEYLRGFLCLDQNMGVNMADKTRRMKDEREAGKICHLRSFIQMKNETLFLKYGDLSSL